MRNKYLLFLLLSAFVLLGMRASATHIVGGECTYRSLGNNNYEIRLTVYRDCFNGQAPFDDPAKVSFFDAFNQEVLMINMTHGPIIHVPNVVNSPCIVVPTSVCYEVATYLDTVNLPPLAGGYQMAYQRCCRNGTINNIITPGNTGATYYAKIPSPGITTVNSSPVFAQLPPTYICAGFPFTFDHSAIDFDGDSLVYALSTPLTGLSSLNPNGNPTPPPYIDVQWQAPYSLANIFGGTPLQINPQTGIITATPNTLGQFVYGVRVKEYRNGLYLGETKREFQVNVINCIGLVVSSISSPVIVCGSTTASFTNASVGAAAYAWNFGDPTTTADVSTAANPTYTYADTGTYTAQLIAVSSAGNTCNDTSYATVHVYPQLVPDIAIQHDICLNNAQFLDSTFSYSGLVNGWTWNFGDGNSSSAQNPNHSYGSPGTYVVQLSLLTSEGCSGVTTDTVQIYPQLDAIIDTIIPAVCPAVCTGAALVLPTNGLMPMTYLWSNGDTNALADSLCPGNYSVQITDSLGCTSTRSANIVYTFHNLISDIQAAACDVSCNGSALADISGGTLPYTYLWSNGDVTAMADSLCPGTYTVLASDSNGCHVLDSVFVIASFHSLIQNQQNVRCFGECNGGASVLATGGTNPYSYTWSDGQSGTIAQGWCPGTYYVSALDSNGCSEIDTVLITQPDVLLDSLTVKDEKCPKDCNGSIVILPQGGTMPYSYSWNSGAADIIDQLAGLCPGWNYVETLDAHGCIVRDSVEIATAFSLPLIDSHPEQDSIYQGQSTLLIADPGVGYDYLWSDPSTLNDPSLASPNATPQQPTNYVLRVTDGNGCVNFDTLQVFVITGYCQGGSVFIPNAFTPDGNGHNDRFMVHAKGISEIALSIFNRWGEEVFQTKDILQGWDGTFKGAEAPADVYVYQLTVVCFDKNRTFHKGNITLIR